MIGQVHDLSKLDTWSVTCVLLEMVMGRAWFNQMWLKTYRNNRKLWRARDAAPPHENFDEFVGILEQGAASAVSSVQTAPASTILRWGLEIQTLQRPSAPELLASYNQTQVEVATQAAELAAFTNLGVAAAAGANDGADAQRTDDHGPTETSTEPHVDGAEQQTPGGTQAQIDTSTSLHMGSEP